MNSMHNSTEYETLDSFSVAVFSDTTGGSRVKIPVKQEVVNKIN